MSAVCVSVQWSNIGIINGLIFSSLQNGTESELNELLCAPYRVRPIFNALHIFFSAFFSLLLNFSFFTPLSVVILFGCAVVSVVWHHLHSAYSRYIHISIFSLNMLVEAISSRAEWPNPKPRAGREHHRHRRRSHVFIFKQRRLRRQCRCSCVQSAIVYF